MREWLSGGASPCQGEGRGFDPRLALSNSQEEIPGSFRVRQGIEPSVRLVLPHSVGAKRSPLGTSAPVSPPARSAHRQMPTGHRAPPSAVHGAARSSRSPTPRKKFLGVFTFDRESNLRFVSCCRTRSALNGPHWGSAPPSRGGRIERAGYLLYFFIFKPLKSLFFNHIALK